MKISVGIITFNRPETLKLVLDALKKQTKKAHEIIVVDNSTDNKTKKLMKSYKNVKYIFIKERIYQPHARNIILKKCNGEVIAFLDDDAVPEIQWLAALEDCYTNSTTGESSKIIGATGPALNCKEPGKPTEKIITSPRNRNYFTSYGDVRSESRRWIPPQPVKCTTMLGANMSFRTSEIKRIWFDEFYGKDAAFREESDPQVTLVKKGYEFVYHPQALAWHMKFAKGGIRSNPQENYYYFCGVNHRHFTDKHFPFFRSRFSWIFWSFSPPCLWLAVLLAVVRRDKNILKWHKGLWFGKKYIR